MEVEGEGEQIFIEIRIVSRYFSDSLDEDEDEGEQV